MRAMLLGGFVFTAAELLMAPERSTLLAGLLLLVAGLGFTVWTSNSNSSLQLEAPDHLRGRVVGLYYYAFNGAGPLGGLLAGWLSDRGGTELALFVGGIAGLLATGAATVALRAPREDSIEVEPRREQPRAA